MAVHALSALVGALVLSVVAQHEAAPLTPEALFARGQAFETDATAPDRELALRAYERAAADGHGQAAYSAGLLHLASPTWRRTGERTQAEQDLAVRYFQLARTHAIIGASQRLASIAAHEQRLRECLILRAQRQGYRPLASADGSEIRYIARRSDGAFDVLTPIGGSPAEPYRKAEMNLTAFDAGAIPSAKPTFGPPTTPSVAAAQAVASTRAMCLF